VYKRAQRSEREGQSVSTAVYLRGEKESMRALGGRLVEKERGERDAVGAGSVHARWRRRRKGALMVGLREGGRRPGPDRGGCGGWSSGVVRVGEVEGGPIRCMGQPNKGRNGPDSCHHGPAFLGRREKKRNQFKFEIDKLKFIQN
jgi:hypothetical protein